MINLRARAGYKVADSKFVGVAPFQRKLVKLRSNADPTLYVVAYQLSDGRYQDSNGKVGHARELQHNKRTQAAAKFKSGF